MGRERAQTRPSRPIEIRECPREDIRHKWSVYKDCDNGGSCRGSGVIRRAQGFGGFTNQHEDSGRNSRQHDELTLLPKGIARSGHLRRLELEPKAERSEMA